MSLAENMEFNQPFGICEEDCCGCAACKAVCPNNAVIMKENRENGFLYPAIDEEKCIHCGKCVLICRRIHQEHENTFYSKAYAATNRDDEARFRAASGAMFEAMARAVLRSKGAVAGVVYTKQLKSAEHVLVQDSSELPALCGTKYFQSDIQGIYREIERFIRETDQTVLFCGTPCQVRALKVFAEEKRIIRNLYTADLLCRGVPSPLAWRKYLDYLEEKHHKKICAVKVKDKEKGWDRIGVMITFEDGSRAYERWFESIFERSFIQTNLAIRESCFSCPYKSIHREGDLTIGDFWGFRNSHLLERNMGTSLMMINSWKGEKLFQQIREDIDCQESTVWRVYRGNLPAFGPVFCDRQEREEFWKLLGRGKNLEEAVNTAAPYSKTW